MKLLIPLVFGVLFILLVSGCVLPRESECDEAGNRFGLFNDDETTCTVGGEEYTLKLIEVKNSNEALVSVNSQIYNVKRMTKSQNIIRGNLHLFVDVIDPDYEGGSVGGIIINNGGMDKISMCADTGEFLIYEGGAVQCRFDDGNVYTLRYRHSDNGKVKRELLNTALGGDIQIGDGGIFEMRGVTYNIKEIKSKEYILGKVEGSKSSYCDINSGDCVIKEGESAIYTTWNGNDKLEDYNIKVKKIIQSDDISSVEFEINGNTMTITGSKERLSRRGIIGTIYTDGFAALVDINTDETVPSCELHIEVSHCNNNSGDYICILQQGDSIDYNDSVNTHRLYLRSVSADNTTAYFSKEGDTVSASVGEVLDHSEGFSFKVTKARSFGGKDTLGKFVLDFVRIEIVQ